MRFGINDKKLSLKVKIAIALALIVLVYAVIQLMIHFGLINRYWQGILLSVCINIILVVSLNITTGFLGQLTLGHAGFMAIGAYGAAYITKTFTMLPPIVLFPLGLLFGGLMALVAGIVVGIPTLRLKGDYLAIITLAFGEVIRNILLNLPFFGGASGYIGIGRYTTFTFAYFLAVLTTIFCYSLIKSRGGRAILAIRENEIAALSSGVNINRYKMIAFIFAAFFAGIAGGLYAHYMGILEPKVFKFDKSIELLVMVVLGGMGNLKGSIFAAIVLTVLPEVLRGLASYRTLIYALALIVMMLTKNSVFLKRFKKSKEDPS